METTGQTSPPRENPRYQVDIKVDCSTRSWFVANRVTNISNGGVFIASERPLPLHAEVQLKLSLDAATTIEARGKVIWTYDIPKTGSFIVPGSGIKFLDLTPENRARLEGYLDQLASLGVTGS